jgi:predicted nucleic acid-binding protein
LTNIFVDTSGWANLLETSEPFHKAAASLLHTVQREGRQVITSNYALAELSALLMSPLRIRREARLTMLERIQTSSWVEVLHVDKSRDAASWEYMLSRRDKDFSLVDCSRCVIMQREGRYKALTTDRHFEQAGFQRLLKRV